MSAERALHRFWFEFDDPSRVWRAPAWAGVTAHDQTDAEQLVCAFFGWEQLPPVSKLIEDVDISALDRSIQAHLLPNMSPPVWRGLWYPAGNLTAQLPYESKDESRRD